MVTNYHHDHDSAHNSVNRRTSTKRRAVIEYLLRIPLDLEDPSRKTPQESPLNDAKKIQPSGVRATSR